MPLFTVMSAERGPAKTTDYGEKAAIKLVLKNGTGDQIEGEWFTRADAPLPVVGGQEDFEVSDGPYGKKLTRPRTGGFGGGRSPRDSGRIERQHSQEMAIRVLAANPANLTPAQPHPTTESIRQVVKDWTDWFVADLDNASSNGGGGGTATPMTQSGPSTAATSSVVAKPMSQPQSDLIGRLLKENDVVAETRNRIIAWATEALTGGPRGSASAAIDGLQDAPAETIPRLEAAASKWAGTQSDVPPPDESDMQSVDELMADDDDIPF